MMSSNSPLSYDVQQQTAVLDEEGELAMLTQYRPESIESLCEQTKFSATEIKTMYRGFKQECPNGHVDEDHFKNIFCQYFPQGGKFWVRQQFFLFL